MRERDYSENEGSVTTLSCGRLRLPLTTPVGLEANTV
jgi:hypothetical protein